MIEWRLQELGIVLPEPPEPKASYVPALQVGNFIYTSGMSSIQNGVRTYVGCVGEDISEDEAYRSAELCALNALSAIRQCCASLDQVRRIVKITGYIRSAPGFHNQHKVLNGASEMVERIFGEQGKHVRSAIGVSELPFGISVEVEMIAELKG